MDDQTTTLSELRKVVARFVEERDWSRFHDPKNLSMALGIEVGELMEHFQWLRSDQLAEVLESPEAMAEVREEVADIAWYLLSLANALGIDLASAMEAKMAKNRAKYPPESYRGRFRLDGPGGSGPAC
ncbi:MAG: nucleotide pyrophosphohydrolase [Planctomycetes bacterium]|nr:nucleotide pyrophosphohydrolase [Planctomycetota bacterium]